MAIFRKIVPISNIEIIKKGTHLNFAMGAILQDTPLLPGLLPRRVAFKSQCSVTATSLDNFLYCPLVLSFHYLRIACATCVARFCLLGRSTNTGTVHIHLKTEKDIVTYELWCPV